MWCDTITTAHRAAVGTSSTAVSNLRTSTSPPTPAWGRRGTRLTRYACRMARRRGARHTTLTGHRSHHSHEPSPRVNVDEAPTRLPQAGLVARVGRGLDGDRGDRADRRVRQGFAARTRGRDRDRVGSDGPGDRPGTSRQRPRSALHAGAGQGPGRVFEGAV